MAVTEAIEKAVSTLVLEGIRMGFGKQTSSARNRHSIRKLC
jgi:hypothetical protein